MKDEITKDATAHIYFDNDGNIQIKGLKMPNKPDNPPQVKRGTREN